MKCSTCGMLFKSSQKCVCDPTWQLGDGDKRSVRHHMGKVHVGESYLFVARDMLRRAHKYPKRARFAVARYALKCHKNNRAQYSYVMGGMA